MFEHPLKSFELEVSKKFVQSMTYFEGTSESEYPVDLMEAIHVELPHKT